MKLPKEYIHSQHCFLLYLHSGRKSEATLQNERDVKKCEELNLFHKWDRTTNTYIPCNGDDPGAYYDYERLYAEYIYDKEKEVYLPR